MFCLNVMTRDVKTGLFPSPNPVLQVKVCVHHWADDCKFLICLQSKHRKKKRSLGEIGHLHCTNYQPVDVIEVLLSLAELRSSFLRFRQAVNLCKAMSVTSHSDKSRILVFAWTTCKTNRNLFYMIETQLIYIARWKSQSQAYYNEDWYWTG